MSRSEVMEATLPLYKSNPKNDKAEKRLLPEESGTSERTTSHT